MGSAWSVVQHSWHMAILVCPFSTVPSCFKAFYWLQRVQNKYIKCACEYFTIVLKALTRQCMSIIHKPHFIAVCFFIYAYVHVHYLICKLKTSNTGHVLQELSGTCHFIPVKFIKIPTTVQKIHSATYRKQEGCHIE